MTITDLKLRVVVKNSATVQNDPFLRSLFLYVSIDMGVHFLNAILRGGGYSLGVTARHLGKGLNLVNHLKLSLSLSLSLSPAALFDAIEQGNADDVERQLKLISTSDLNM